MKKIMLALWLTLSLVGCAAPAVTSIPSPSVAETPSVVTFADPVLEAMVRATMGKPGGRHHSGGGGGGNEVESQYPNGSGTFPRRRRLRISTGWKASQTLKALTYPFTRSPISRRWRGLKSSPRCR